MKSRKIVVISIVALMVLSFAGCSKEVKNPTDTLDPNPTETVQPSPEVITKEELGIRFELPSTYANCKISDATFSGAEYSGLDIVGGFNITYAGKKNEATVATVFVATRTSLDSSDIRSQCNFILTGIDYSVAAIIPEVSNIPLEDDDYSVVTGLQDGVIDILSTLFFDESSFAPTDFEGGNPASTEPGIEVNSKSEPTDIPNNEPDVPSVTDVPSVDENKPSVEVDYVDNAD